MSVLFDAQRAAMIDSQLRPTGVNDVRVIEAFIPVPREAFVPESKRALAYIDEALEIAPGRFIMEPLIFGNLVMRAELESSDRVLLVGSSSGYEAAVLGRLVRTVIAVESDAALAATARAALAGVGAGNVQVVEGPLTDGWEGEAPYDVVMLNGAAERLPEALTVQLADGGRFAGVMIDTGGVGRATVGRKAAGAIGMSAFLDAGTRPLPGFERPRGFRF